MRTLIFAAIAAAGLASLAPQAVAQPRNDLAQAIALCRQSVAEQAGVDVAHVRLNQARERGRSVSVSVAVWNANSPTNVRCDVAKGDTLTIASITPPLSTATAQR